MNSRTHLMVLTGGALAGLALGLGLLALPAWQTRSKADAERSDLEERMAGLTDQTATVTKLADRLDERRNELERELKRIPPTPDVADLMRSLSLPADGATVLDQTFTAGAPGDAVIGRPGIERVVPLTVDMRSRFDAVFALIRASESMDRLVRIASVRLALDPKHADAPSPIVEGSIGLEVVYAGGEDE